MALIFYSVTECPICGKVLNENEDIIAFPAFMSNMKDDLFFFNDAGFHRSCVMKHPFGMKAIKYGEEFFFRTKPENRICIVSKKRITKMDDYLFTGVLSSDENETISRFNFITIDRTFVKEWPDRKSFLDAAGDFIKDDKWKGFASSKYLEQLIRQFQITMD